VRTKCINANIKTMSLESTTNFEDWEEIEGGTHVYRKYNPLVQSGARREYKIWSDTILSFDHMYQREQEDDFKVPMEKFENTKDAKAKQQILDNNSYFEVCYRVHELLQRINNFYWGAYSLLLRIRNELGLTFLVDADFDAYKARIEQLLELVRMVIKNEHVNKFDVEGESIMEKYVDTFGKRKWEQWYPTFISQYLENAPTIQIQEESNDIDTEKAKKLISWLYIHCMVVKALIEELPFGERQDVESEVEARRAPFIEFDYISVNKNYPDIENIMDEFGEDVLYNVYNHYIYHQTESIGSTSLHDIAGLTKELHDKFGLGLELAETPPIQGNGLPPIITPVNEIVTDTRIETENGVYHASPATYYIFAELYDSIDELSQQDAHILYRPGRSDSDPGGSKYQETRASWYKKINKRDEQENGRRVKPRA